MFFQCSDVTFSWPLSEHYYLLLVHNGDPIVMNCDALTFFMLLVIPDLLQLLLKGMEQFTEISLWEKELLQEVLTEFSMKLC